jgi:hypothetical protein
MTRRWDDHDHDYNPSDEDLDDDFPEPMLTLYIGSVTEPVHLPLPEEPGGWLAFWRGLWCGVKMSAAMIAAAVLIVLWWAGCEPRAHGQEHGQERPSASAEQWQQQRYWTRAEIGRQAALVSGLAADAITTQRILGRGGHEEDPLARPLVTHGWAGQMAATGLAYGGHMAGQWWLRRKGHGTMARRETLGYAAAEWTCAGANMRLWGERWSTAAQTKTAGTGTGTVLTLPKAR